MAKTSIIYTEESDLGGKGQEKGLMVTKSIADLTLNEFLWEFIVPLLRGMGYSERVINLHIK